MAYQALYRKYRPHSFEDFDDQDNIKKILVNSIKNNTISHAYLFSGPRGIGKTSMAKIFAKAINCLNFNEHDDVCEHCDNCLESNDNSVDIIEMDAASNNGVDQIRDLKNKVSIVPSKLKYKVYIIDEVHMLTNSAFNALLKTLEEPPSHVVFILATTEFYEVPETIVSRCQCYSFSRISMKSLEKRLHYIADKEQIAIDDDAITEIAHYSNGGFRDAIGMLDKVHSFTNEKITSDIFKQINGMISLREIESFYESVFNKDLNRVISMIDKINEQGYDFKNFVEREMILVRDKVINYYTKKENVQGTIAENIELISVLNDILNRLKDAINPMVIIQIYILKYIEKIDCEKHNVDKIISREIIQKQQISEKNAQNDDAKVTKMLENNTNDSLRETENHNNGKISNKDLLFKSTQIKINEEVKNIRINNSMATANITLKKELTSLWKKMDEYFMDKKYGKVAQLLSDCEPMVVGSEYCILTALSEGIINNIYANLTVSEEFIKTIYNPLKIVVIKNDEFGQIKNKYIEDKKNNIVYQIKEECGKLVDDGSNLVNQAINIFGTDMVEIE